MGVSKNRGKTPKRMVKIMENPIRMDDLGYHYFRKQPYTFTGWWQLKHFLNLHPYLGKMMPKLASIFFR